MATRISSWTIEGSYMEELAGGSAEFILEVIDKDLVEIPFYREQMAGEIVKNDNYSVANVAHKIKPIFSLYMGHTTTFNVCRDIENAGLKGDFVLIRSKFSQFEYLTNVFLLKLQSEREKIVAKIQGE